MAAKTLRRCCNIKHGKQANFCANCGKRLPAIAPPNPPRPIKQFTTRQVSGAANLSPFIRSVLHWQFDTDPKLPSAERVQILLVRLYCYDQHQVLIRWYGLDGSRPTSIWEIAQESNLRPEEIKRLHDEGIDKLHYLLCDLLDYEPNPRQRQK